jgi:hypothetical protein
MEVPIDFCKEFGPVFSFLHRLKNQSDKFTHIKRAAPYAKKELIGIFDSAQIELSRQLRIVRNFKPQK